MGSMTCEKCKKDHATYHLTAIENGQKKETHLCEGCARSSGVGTNFNFSMSSILGGANEGKGKTKSGGSGPKGKCPECGMTFAEFRKQMRVGCANDYEFFGKEIHDLIKKIHGADQHTGKVPGKNENSAKEAAEVAEVVKAARAIKEKENELSRLKKELDTVVVAENYEKAAQIRDRIKVIETELPKKT